MAPPTQEPERSHPFHEGRSSKGRFDECTAHVQKRGGIRSEFEPPATRCRLSGPVLAAPRRSRHPGRRNSSDARRVSESWKDPLRWIFQLDTTTRRSSQSSRRKAGFDRFYWKPEPMEPGEGGSFQR